MSSNAFSAIVRSPIGNSSGAALVARTTRSIVRLSLPPVESVTVTVTLRVPASAAVGVHVGLGLTGTSVDQSGSRPVNLMSLVLEENADGIVFIECQADLCARNTYVAGFAPKSFGPLGEKAYQSFTYQGDVAGALKALEARSAKSFAFEELLTDQPTPARGTLEIRVGEVTPDGPAGAGTLLFDIVHHYPTASTTARTKLHLPERRILAFDYEDPIETYQLHVTLAGSALLSGSDWRQRVDVCVAKDPKNLDDFCGCGLVELTGLCAVATVK